MRKKAAVEEWGEGTRASPKKRWREQLFRFPLPLSPAHLHNCTCVCCAAINFLKNFMLFSNFFTFGLFSLFISDSYAEEDGLSNDTTLDLVS